MYNLKQNNFHFISLGEKFFSFFFFSLVIVIVIVIVRVSPSSSSSSFLSKLIITIWFLPNFISVLVVLVIVVIVVFIWFTYSLLLSHNILISSFCSTTPSFPLYLCVLFNRILFGFCLIFSSFIFIFVFFKLHWLCFYFPIFRW